MPYQAASGVPVTNFSSPAPPPTYVVPPPYPSATYPASNETYGAAAEPHAFYGDSGSKAADAYPGVSSAAPLSSYPVTPVKTALPTAVAQEHAGPGTGTAPSARPSRLSDYN